MMKKVMSILFCALLLAGMCSAEDKPLRMTFVTPLVAHPVWDVAREGFEAACEEFKVECQYTGPQTIEPGTMITQMETAIVERVDGLITMAMNPESWGPTLKKAEKAGVTVVLVGSDIPVEDGTPKYPRLAYVGTNEHALGVAGAQEIVKALNGAAPKVITMQSTMDAAFANKTRDAYLEVLSQQEGYELLAMEDCQSDMLIALQKWEGLLKAHPAVNVAIGVCGECGPSAAKVAKEMGITDKLLIMSIDDVAETMDHVRKDMVMGTMAQNFYAIGYQPVKIIAEYLRDGKKPEKDNFDSGSVFVSKENIDTYQEDLKN